MSNDLFHFDFASGDLTSFDAHLDALLAADPTLVAASTGGSGAVAPQASVHQTVASTQPHHRPHHRRTPSSDLTPLLGDAATLYAAGGALLKPAEFDALLDSALDLTALFAGADASAPGQTAHVEALALDDLPSLEPVAPQQQVSSASVTAATVSAAPRPIQALTVPATPVLTAAPQQSLMATMPMPASAVAPAPQLFSVVNMPSVVVPNGVPATVLVPLQPAAAGATTSAMAAAQVPVPVPVQFNVMPTAAPQQQQQHQPALVHTAPAPVAAAAQNAAASLSAYHQHRLQEATSVSAMATSATAVAAAGAAQAGLKPLLPAATPLAPAPATSVPSSGAAAAARPMPGPNGKVMVPEDRLQWPDRLIKMDAPIQKKKRGVVEIEDPEEEARRLKNTLSARRSRAKRAARVEFLEASVFELTQENDALKAELAQARAQLAAAHAQLATAGVSMVPPRV